MKPVRETIKKELAMFRLALGLAEKRGKFRGNIKALMPEFKVRYVPKKRFLPEKEYKALLAALPAHRRKWVQLAVYTGARLSEVEGLEWSDVKGKHLHLRGTKTEKSDRFVPLHPALKKALGKAGKGPIVEHWPNVGRDLGAACKRIGITHTTPKRSTPHLRVVASTGRSQ